ncbi:MAG: right-handed parallel beta-helix repeat-containing protein, partial [Myxococcota bacterium]
MRATMRTLGLLVLAVGSCGGGDDVWMAATDGTTAGSDSTDTGDGGAGAGGGTTSPCEPFGYFDPPETTFTLPLDEGTFYPDVQASFPEVDWQTLDRLYLPAGAYPQLNIGNLPDRTAERPLVITNLGGQVQVGPADNANYIFVLSGGSHWVLTGRYDEEAKTGDSDFPGHRCGEYGNSRGRYGIVSDDAFDLDAPFLHMGIGFGDISDVEVEFVEVTRSGFAGIRMLNREDDTPGKPMANIRIHDTYIHDVDGEGIYLGWTGAPPSALIPGLQVYNNRFVRTGNEALQVQNLGSGSRIHHNAVAYAALRWLDNSLGDFQDSNTQIGLREGEVVVEDDL